MKKLLCFFGWFNILPVNILAWLFWFLPNYIMGSFSDITIWPNGMITWDIDNSSKLFKKLKKDNWWGFVIGSNVVFIDYFANTDDAKHLRHEETHVVQNYKWGILFYPYYIARSLYIYYFTPSKHPYLDNPFEIEAREKAGQQVRIPVEEWKYHGNDRWPWF